MLLTVLAARYRMRRSEDFRHTVRRGRRTASSTVVVHRSSSESSTHAVNQPPLVGFVVSRSVGNAVTRNTVVRRLRHVAGEHLTLLHPGDRVVVRATPRAAGASSAQLDADLARCLNRLVPRATVRS